GRGVAPGRDVVRLFSDGRRVAAGVGVARYGRGSMMITGLGCHGTGVAAAGGAV
ncbi:MAG: hypothetical protein JWM87_2822, partial [Candidatus Eremiobacteraeota bacterium]|nr:hypothetical protein [Candidatus Eremiobacteraeota bacterium]